MSGPYASACPREGLESLAVDSGIGPRMASLCYHRKWVLLQLVAVAWPSVLSAHFALVRM